MSCFGSLNYFIGINMFEEFFGVNSYWHKQHFHIVMALGYFDKRNGNKSREILPNFILSSNCFAGTKPDCSET